VTTTTSGRIKLAALAFSAAGLVALATSESYTDRAIIPIAGDVPTIGFGTTEGVKMGDRTTPVKALARIALDISGRERSMKRCMAVDLHQYEYDAYVQLAYNIGVPAFCGSTLVRKLNAGDYAGACAEISKWNRAGGRVVHGLTVRRAEERATCEGR
jgi:lysozyme